ncbi:MAG: radical SAM protein [Candidatus Omnitrophica bacterium]|nr:radical SAM protein [Candidatus Omnitrophota bacterium]
MKILICFPPLNSEKGWPTLGQNRQFQYFKEPTYIYPVVPAQAATLLKESGFEVQWLDCIAEGISYDSFLEIIKKEKPDLVAMEVKTPVVNQEWQIINDLKKLRTTSYELRTVLFGDHVTALPEESFKNSKVDFVLTGGDYDFLLLNLCNVLKEAKLSIINYQLSSKLESGIWYWENGEAKSTGQFQLNHDLNTLPFIDRDLTKWKLYAYKNGNYRRRPGTYIMSGRDCWWGKCRFCSWTTLYPQFRSRSVKNVLDEIEYLVNNYSIKEIMDDTGTFPVGGWLEEFCKGIIERKLNKKINFDCNMRFGAVDYEMYKLMRKAGFRFLLFGIESANQNTLDRIDKNLKVENIIQSCKDARRAGLYPHITIMFGYPWESYEDAKKTLDLGRWLLKKDYAYTMQATVVIPYPGTPLFQECKDKDLLMSYDWSYYDMKNPVMKLNFNSEELSKLVQGMYSVSFNPEFILRKIISIREIDDIKYFGRAFLKVIGHIIDFRKKSKWVDEKKSR